MRMMPSRYVVPQASTVKRGGVSQVAHITPPLKGLSLATRLTPGDPQTATILTNFVIEDDRILVRAGYRKKATRGSSPVWGLIPFHGDIPALLAASNHELWNAQDGSLTKGGFTRDDWHWTSFSNLAAHDYTVMVNGADGVWSWDGALTSTTLAPVTVTGMTKANPAVVTVATGDIGKFKNGDTVVVAGATGAGWTNANGQHFVYYVGTPANSFTLVGVDTSTATGTMPAGITVQPAGTGVVKETVTTNAADPWIDVNQFQVVLSHQNRLWFADSSNLAVYYLPIQQKSGEVSPFPLHAIFRRGGSIRALATWTVDGGRGMDDQLVIFTSNGECAIYSGTNPDSPTDWQLVGVFRFDAPMSKHCVTNYGGDLYVLISTGLVPMTTVIRAETENLGQSDRSVISIFLKEAIKYRADIGWQTFLNPSSGRLFCNIPEGADNHYKQLIRHMPRAIWSTFEDVPARCWNWIDPYVYFGDDKGNVYEMHPAYLSDDGQPIRADVQMAWSQFKTPARKHFNMIQIYLITDGNPKPVVDVKVDYDYSPGINTPDVSFAQPGADWDLATWDVDYWAGGERAITIWNGVSQLGRAGAPRFTASIYNCSLAITGWDITYEQGSIL